jgi:Tfp pilus assembly protein PilN
MILLAHSPAASADPADGRLTDAQQIERHFKMGEFLTQHQALKERIEEIREFLKTEEGQQALQKMMEVRQKLA